MDFPRTLQWHHDISREHWRVLAAATLAWALAVMDAMLYGFALNNIRTEFQMSTATAGALTSVALLASACGGILFGWRADRAGRRRNLVYSILIYSFFTAMTATAANFSELLLWRVFAGIGLGGAWTTAAVLVAETWPAQHRGKAIGIMQSGHALGYILAAVLTATLLPAQGWRLLFVLGILPAFLTFWMRARVPEPAMWREQKKREAAPINSLRAVLQPPYAIIVLHVSLLVACVLLAHWGLFTWLPNFIAATVAEGGAGLGIVKSINHIIFVEIGALMGCILFGYWADRFGRKPVFIFFMITAAALAPIYGIFARSEMMLLLCAPLLGFFGYGYFSVFGALLAELFPTAMRGMGLGVSYHLGRAFSALAPFTFGAFTTSRGFTIVIVLTSTLFLLGAALMRLLPETKGMELVQDELRP